MAFDGRVLHGVIPGAGASAQPARRRVTFMVAFWASCQTRGAAEDGPGAARAFPAAVTHAAPMPPRRLSHGRSRAAAADAPRSGPPHGARAAVTRRGVGQGKTSYTWHLPMEPLVPAWDSLPPKEAAAGPSCVPVSRIWDKVGEEGGPGAAAGGSAARAAARGGARLPGYEDCFQGF